MSHEVRTDRNGLREITITDENGDRLWLGQHPSGDHYQGRAQQAHRPQDDGGAAAYIAKEDLVALRDLLLELEPLEPVDDEIFLVVPSIEDPRDSRDRIWQYEQAVEEIGYFATQVLAQAWIDIRVNIHVLSELAKFEVAEEQRKEDYQRRVRNRAKALKEHQVLLAAGLHGPDQEPRAVGVFVPKEFDEEKVKRTMEPRYSIEEVRKA